MSINLKAFDYFKNPFKSMDQNFKTATKENKA